MKKKILILVEDQNVLPFIETEASKLGAEVEFVKSIDEVLTQLSNPTLRPKYRGLIMQLEKALLPWPTGLRELLENADRFLVRYVYVTKDNKRGVNLPGLGVLIDRVEKGLDPWVVALHRVIGSYHV